MKWPSLTAKKVEKFIVSKEKSFIGQATGEKIDLTKVVNVNEEAVTRRHFKTSWESKLRC